MNPEPHLGDLLDEIEARTAFLSFAVGAFGCADHGMLPNTKAWYGFYLLTLDLLKMTERANARNA